MKNKILVCLSLSLSLVSCVTTPTPSSGSSVPASATNLDSIAFPRITSSGWIRSQTSPELGLNGLPCVRYKSVADRSTSVEIYFQGKSPQWVKTTAPEFITIMGHKVQTYGSGNEVVAFATQPLLLASPDGSSSYYTFDFTGDNLYKSRNIPTFSW